MGLVINALYDYSSGSFLSYHLTYLVIFSEIPALKFFC